MIEKIGKWWGGSIKTKKQEEIDIVAVGNDAILLGECKYRTEPVEMDVLLGLFRRGELFDYERKYFVLFSKSGFSKDLENYAFANDHVLLVSEFVC